MRIMLHTDNHMNPFDMASDWNDGILPPDYMHPNNMLCILEIGEFDQTILIYLLRIIEMHLKYSSNVLFRHHVYFKCYIQHNYLSFDFDP